MLGANEERKKEIFYIQVGIWIAVSAMTFILLLIIRSPWCLLVLFLPAVLHTKDIFYLDKINKDKLVCLMGLCAIIVSFLAVSITSNSFCWFGILIPVILIFQAERKWEAEVKQWDNSTKKVGSDIGGS